MPASFFFATGTTVPFSKYAIYCAAAVEAQVGNSAAEVAEHIQHGAPRG